jgi:exodeoxyribonuclease V alpha subunit
LRASRFVATPESGEAEADAAPLVFERGLLYLRRYREYERRLALQLQRIAAHTIDGEIEALAPLFSQLFPQATDSPPSPFAGDGQARSVRERGIDDRQARAAALALRRALLLVTGGPGTGKTTTIARLLVLRIAQASQAERKPPRIALAAPTGRAAERMADSLRRAVQQMATLGIDEALLAALPTQAGTLHRLLRTIPDSPRFRHHADNPLPFDIVVVDEASMVDLPLMCKLTEAVAAGAQLVLLGDADQLPSVEAGDVLAAILAAAGPGDALAEEDARALQPLLGGVFARHPRAGGDRSTAPDPHPHEGEDRSPALDRHPREGGDRSTAFALDPPKATSKGRSDSRLRGNDDLESNASRLSRVHLIRGYRQSDALHLAPLAEAVRNGEANEALRLLRGRELSNVHFHEGADDPLQARPDLLAHWRALSTHTDPAQALRDANRLRLLTALREGAQGARGLNARIEAQLSGRRLGTPPAWFPGRLLLITRNSYRHGLFNGDVGLCLADEAGVPLAWFAGSEGGQVRAFHPAALPAHESAFAMTVHKAQGSEFDEVWLQLPRSDSRVLSHELLYTGITRARSALHVAGSAEVIAAALGRHAGRVSGLGWRLVEGQV